MSDIKVYSLKHKKEFANLGMSIIDVRTIVNDASSVLGIDVIENDYTLLKESDSNIATLAYDENYQLVVVEYRLGKFGRLINKGLYYIDYIKEHVSEFKLLITEKKGKDIANRINYNPRLLIISDNASYFDEYAIKRLPYMIDIIKVGKLESSVVAFEKIFQSKKIDHTNFKHTFKDNNTYNIYNMISEYILSLGDEVIETGNGNYLYYRRIKTFAYIYFEDGLNIYYMLNKKFKSKAIKTIEDFEKIQDELERAYDEN